MHMETYMHIQIQVCNSNTYVYNQIYACIFKYTCLYSNMCVYIQMCAYSNVCIHILMCTCIFKRIHV